MQGSSFDISDFVSKTAEKRNLLWNKLNVSLSFVTQLNQYEPYSASKVPAPSLKSTPLVSGTAPEELHQALVQVESRVEVIKLTQKEIDTIEQDIKEVKKKYARVIFGLLILCFIIFVYFAGWQIQLLAFIGFIAWLKNRPKRQDQKSKGKSKKAAR